MADGPPSVDCVKVNESTGKSQADRFILDESTVEEIKNDYDKLEAFKAQAKRGIRTARAASDYDEIENLSHLHALAQERQKALLAKADVRMRFEFEVVRPDVETQFSADKFAGGEVVKITSYNPTIQDATSLYIRAHLVEQMAKVESFLLDRVKYKLYVAGAPGCGKTSFFWMWAQMLMKKGKRVLFIQYKTDQPSLIWVLENGSMTQLKSPQPHPSVIFSVISELLMGQKAKFDICICDGIIVSDTVFCNSLRSVLHGQLDVLARGTPSDPSKKISKLVYVTSLQFHISLGQEMQGKREIVDDMSFDSWSFEDYENAAASSLVEDKVVKNILVEDWDWVLRIRGSEADNLTPSDVKELNRSQILTIMRQKYYYAGGCARFMFQTSGTELLRRLGKLFGRVKNDNWKEFANNSPEALTDTAVNSLMQQFSTENGLSICTPVSKYVMFHAYEKCRRSLTLAVKAAAAATGNPVLLGWAFELDQLDTIGLALEGNCRGTSVTTAVKTNRHALLTFIPKAEAWFDGSAITGNSKDGAAVVVSGTVIWCSKFNQGCFDVALYFDTTLITLQFTTAATHDLKLEYIRHLRTALINKRAKIETIVHLGVVESGKVGIFKFKEPSGTSRVGAKDTFQVKVDKSDELETIEVHQTSWINKFYKRLKSQSVGNRVQTGTNANTYEVKC